MKITENFRWAIQKANGMFRQPSVAQDTELLGSQHWYKYDEQNRTIGGGDTGATRYPF